MDSRVFRASAALAALLAAFAPNASAQPVRFTPVALSGTEAPGATGTVFGSFSRPLINAGGDLAFSATLDSGSQAVTALNRDGIWLARSGQAVRLVARTGAAAPLFTSNGTFRSLGRPALDPGGYVAFRGILNTGSGVTASNDEGIWLTSAGFVEGTSGAPPLWLVAREAERAVIDAAGTVAPSGSGLFDVFGNPSFGPGGALVFTAELRAGAYEDHSGVWHLSRPPGAPTASDRPLLTALAPDTAPGVGGGVFRELQTPSLAASLQAFRATLAAGGLITPASAAGLWSGTPGSFSLVAQAGSPAPGTQAAFSTFGRPVANAAGLLAFAAELTSSAQSAGIWLRESGAVAPLALAGSPAPDWEGGGVFGSFFDPSLSSDGRAAFLAFIRTGEGEPQSAFPPHGIWSQSGDGSLRARVRSGDQVPGAAPGLVFAGLGSPRFNARGQIAFTAVLQAADGHSGAPEFSCWASDTNGFLLPVVRQGARLQVGANDERSVARASISDLTEDGKLAVAITFSDGTSGVFLAEINLAKVGGSGWEIGSDIRHPNDNIYDQILLTGKSATITADPGQVTRISFVDLNDDIVQVEFSGSGTLTITLASESGPAPPLKYTQPGIHYMKGHAALVIDGAAADTYLSIFSVGRANAVNPDLFQDVAYDGIADVASLTINSPTGTFGAIFAGNAAFSNVSGFTGIQAPGVSVQGPVRIADVTAFDTAEPRLVFGSVDEVTITGGDLRQDNGKPVQVGGITRVRLTPGTTSHGVGLPAGTIQGKLEHNGVDVTDALLGN